MSAHLFVETIVQPVPFFGEYLAEAMSFELNKNIIGIAVGIFGIAHCTLHIT